jgi:hypothetical protein
MWALPALSLESSWSTILVPLSWTLASVLSWNDYSAYLLFRLA